MFSKNDRKQAARDACSAVRGNELGITTEVRTDLNGNYAVVLYNRAAQQFIIDNIDSVIAGINQRK